MVRGISVGMAMGMVTGTALDTIMATLAGMDAATGMVGAGMVTTGSHLVTECHRMVHTACLTDLGTEGLQRIVLVRLVVFHPPMVLPLCPEEADSQEEAGSLVEAGSAATVLAATAAGIVK
jgi:hypothetical protein